jgi:methyl-accepting chemotaxis protein
MRLRVPFPAPRRVRLRLPAPRLPAPRRITLRAKLVGLIGGIGALLALLTAVGVVNLGRVSERGQHTFTHVTRPLAALGRARALVNENATLAERHILEDARENKLTLEKRIAANDREIDRQIALAAPTLTTPAERRGARFLRANLAAYRGFIGDLFGTSRSSSPQNAYEWSSQRLDPAVDQVNSDLQQLFDAKVAEGDGLADHATATYHSARGLVLALLALLFAIGLLASVLIIRGIRVSVEAILARLASLRGGDVAGLRAGLDRLAEGDLTYEVVPVTPPIARRTRDEVGDVADAVGEIRDHTVASVQAYNACRIGLATMIGTVSETATALSSASRQLASGSEDTGRAVGEIASAVEQVAAGAERQVLAVSSARDVVEGVARATTQSADGARETAAAAEEARRLATNGAQAVREATDAMGAVRLASSAATEAIAELGAKSAQINGIVETITGIAEQTNLLALNAAIEAARAGDQGRGFAVVADEVRKLAEESRAAAASIARLIGAIQSDTRHTVDVVEDGARRTAQTAATVERAREAFEAIGGAVDSMAERANDIAAAVRQAAEGSSRVQRDIVDVAAVAQETSASTEQVSATTQQTSAATQQIAAAAQELSGRASELERMVGRFVLSPS